MKTPSTELYTLIKSLSSQEKRYFKLFTQAKSSETSYIKLFDAIDSLEFYDEKKLIAILAKKGGVKNLNRIKNYLQEAVFKFLEQHYSDHSIAIELQRLLQRIEILYTKRLYDLAYKTIGKAEQLAVKNDDHYYLLIVFHWKYRMILLRSNPEELRSYLEEGHSTELKHIEIYKNIVGYKKINAQRAAVTNFQSTDREAKTIKGLNTLLAEPLLKDESKAISLRAKEMYYHNLGQIYFWLRDWRNCYQNKKQSIRLFEQNPSYEQDKTNAYVVDIGFIIGALTYLRKNDELLLYKNKAEQFIQLLPKKLRTASLYNAYMVVMTNYISYQVSSLNIPEALKESEKLKLTIQKYGTEQALKVFYFNFFRIHFYLSDYHKALIFINKILNMGKTKIRQDIFNMAKIANIMVHYELGNEEALPGLCRSTRNYLEKKKLLNDAYIPLLDFFYGIIRMKYSKEEKLKAFVKLKKDVELALIGSKELDDFDIISWLQSKIEKRPFADMVREKVKIVRAQSN